MSNEAKRTRKKKRQFGDSDNNISQDHGLNDDPPQKILNKHSSSATKSAAKQLSPMRSN